MTRRRRRKLRGILKCTAAVILPLIVAAGARGAKYVDRAVNGGALLMDSTGSAEAPPKADRQEVSRVTFSELPDESIMLSQGYGIEDESDGNRELLRLPSPLDMKADNAGEKPYPARWETGDGEIIRTTYGLYSGNAFFGLEGGGTGEQQDRYPQRGAYP